MLKLKGCILLYLKDELILLQVLEDGHVTDAQGRKVSFKNTIIILTSNLGADVIMQSIDDLEYDESLLLVKHTAKLVPILLSGL